MQTDKLRMQLRKRILDHYLTVDPAGRFPNAPKTDDELYEFIVNAYNVRIPRKVVTDGHRAPFTFVADLFFERARNVLGFANRSGGKTLNLAIVDHLDMIFKADCETCGAGATKDQANRRYKYFRGFIELGWFRDLNERYRDVTGRLLCDPSQCLQSRTEFGNGARQEIITASQTGFRGPHPHKSRVDEIDELDWATLEVGLSMAISGRNRFGQEIRAQNVFTSTRQYMDGTMQLLLDTAQEKGIDIYEWNAWEALEKCTRRCKGDKQYGDCPVFTFCRGQAHHCDGFYTIDDFIDKVRLIDRETFETEWLNLRPKRQKLVYHMYSPSRHIMTPERLFAITGSYAPRSDWYRIGGIDFGSSPGHPFVFLQFVQIPRINAWMLYHEYVAHQRLIRDHAIAIQNVPFYFPGEIVYCDWDPQDRLELKDHGIRTRKAHKGPGSVLMGIDFICTLLNGFPPDERPGLYFWHENTEYTLHEIGRYSWPVGSDGRPDRSGNPEKKNDHCSDAMRMALFSHNKSKGPTYRAYRAAGL